MVTFITILFQLYLFSIFWLAEQHQKILYQTNLQFDFVVVPIYYKSTLEQFK